MLKSKFKLSNELLKKYIILTDKNISFTGYESDYITKKSIELSKQFINETEEILNVNVNKDKVQEIAQQLLNSLKI